MAKSENLIKSLIALPHEYEWLDFKESWFSKDEIGEYISAISNGAALCGREFGYGESITLHTKLSARL